jgi:hypothetical protein
MLASAPTGNTSGEATIPASNIRLEAMRQAWRKRASVTRGTPPSSPTLMTPDGLTNLSWMAASPFASATGPDSSRYPAGTSCHFPPVARLRIASISSRS